MGIARILVVDDEPALRDILRAVLEAAGFAVAEASDGEQALDAVRAQPPDLLILDYMMPGLAGPAVCDRLKQDMLLRHVPVIMLTGKSEVQDKVEGINAGADDYLVKPFDPRELVARVRMVLRRTARDLEANPLTKLPGNISILHELERRIALGGSLAMCYIDLDRFKTFNDHYGFRRGDEVIQLTAALVLRASRAHGTSEDFVGHIGGDDFVVITTAERAEGLCEAIIRDFDAMAPDFHDEKDRTCGYMLHSDRQGHQVKVPLLSISIALVTSDAQPLTHPGQVARIGAELKAYAKQFDRSTYIKERRRNGNAP